MKIGVLGANFKSCSLALREKMAQACQRRLALLTREARLFSCVVLSTCNRIEIYFSGDDLAEAHSSLLGILKEEISLPFEHCLYSYFGIDCFVHLAEVAAGLDSAIVAETEIQRQVKQAYETRTLHSPLPHCMHYLFQKSLHLGKEIRRDFSLTSQGSSLPELLFELGIARLPNVRNLPILLVGFSEMNRQILSFLKQKECRFITLSSRGGDEVREFTRKESLFFLPWSQTERWTQFSWVIGGSTAPGYPIQWQEGKWYTRLICDVSIPRIVDPQIGKDPQIVMYDMEDFVGQITARQKTNQETVLLAKKRVCKKIESYEKAFLLKTSDAVSQRVAWV